jgi:hypothetical protein
LRSSPPWTFRLHAVSRRHGTTKKTRVSDTPQRAFGKEYQRCRLCTERRR